MTDRKQHWEQVYTNKSALEVSWYQAEPEAIEGILGAAVNSVNSGNSSIGEALELATNRINQYMRK